MRKKPLTVRELGSGGCVPPALPLPVLLCTNGRPGVRIALRPLLFFRFPKNGRFCISFLVKTLYTSCNERAALLQSGGS